MNEPVSRPVVTQPPQPAGEVLEAIKRRLTEQNALLREALILRVLHDGPPKCRATLGLGMGHQAGCDLVAGHGAQHLDLDYGSRWVDTEPGATASPWSPELLEAMRRARVIVHPPEPEAPQPTDWETLGMHRVANGYEVERDGESLRAHGYEVWWLVDILSDSEVWECATERDAFDLCAFLLDSAAGGAVPVDPAAPKNANEETKP